MNPVRTINGETYRLYTTVSNVLTAEQAEAVLTAAGWKVQVVPVKGRLQIWRRAEVIDRLLNQIVGGR